MNRLYFVYSVRQDRLYGNNLSPRAARARCWKIAGRVSIYQDAGQPRFPYPVETWIDGKKQTPEIICESPAAHVLADRAESDRAAAIAAWSEYEQLEKPIDVTSIRGGSL